MMNQRKLDVYLYGKKVCVLSDRNTAMRFDYVEDAEYPISVRMPVSDKLYRDKFARPFFENLLPEADIKDVIAKKFGVSRNNPISLLFEIGGDCAGAVSLYSENQIPSQCIDKVPPKEISDSNFLSAIKNLPKSPLLSGNDIRLSLAGAQPKLALIYKDDKMYYPDDCFFSTHIVKRDKFDYPGVVENEYFCMILALKLGLDVPFVEIKEVGHIKTLFIERYDRTKEERIHQEDFCQCLGLTSDRKYQKDGGLSLKNCFNFIGEHSSTSGKDKLRFIQALVFNVLIGNNDAHAKNFSMLHKKDDGFILAPFYDLLSTCVYPDLSKTFAMRIGAEEKSDQLRLENFDQLAKDLSIKVDFILAEIQKQTFKIVEIAKTLKSEMLEQGLFHPIIDKIICYIESRVSVLSIK